VVKFDKSKAQLEDFTDDYIRELRSSQEIKKMKQVGGVDGATSCVAIQGIEDGLAFCGSFGWLWFG
jgi:hypothetical protein